MCFLASRNVSVAESCRNVSISISLLLSPSPGIRSSLDPRPPEPTHRAAKRTASDAMQNPYRKP